MAQGLKKGSQGLSEVIPQVTHFERLGLATYSPRTFLIPGFDVLIATLSQYPDYTSASHLAENLSTLSLAFTGIAINGSPEPDRHAAG